MLHSQSRYGTGQLRSGKHRGNEKAVRCQKTRSSKHASRFGAKRAGHADMSARTTAVGWIIRQEAELAKVVPAELGLGVRA